MEINTSTYHPIVPSHSHLLPTFTVKSNVHVLPSNQEIYNYPSYYSASPVHQDFGIWDSLPSTPDTPNPNSTSNLSASSPSESSDTVQPLITPTPSSRALKAKRRPINECQCGGKPGCDNHGCQQSIGCHPCPVCGIQFSRKNSMRRHVLTHINLRPYHCSHCDKSFYRSDIYKRHLVSKRCKRNTTNHQFLALCQNLPNANPYPANYL